MLHLKAKKTSSSCRISQSLEIPPPQNRDHTPVKAKNQITLFPDFVRSFDDQQTMIDGTIRIHVETGLFFIFQQNASVKNKAHQFGVVAPETAMNQQALSFYWSIYVPDLFYISSDFFHEIWRLTGSRTSHRNHGNQQMLLRHQLTPEKMSSFKTRLKSSSSGRGNFPYEIRVRYSKKSCVPVILFISVVFRTNLVNKH